MCKCSYNCTCAVVVILGTYAVVVILFTCAFVVIIEPQVWRSGTVVRLLDFGPRGPWFEPWPVQISLWP